MLTRASLDRRLDRGWKILLVLALLLGAAFYSATAQIGDADACRTACREAHSRCVSICGEHSNPMECESRCEEEAEDCEESCP